MKGVYEQTGGKLNEDVSMWEVGESMGWERTKTTAVYERLADKGLIELFTLEGKIVLPLGGLEFCEDRFGAFEGRQENRIRLLKTMYHETEGARRNIANIFSVGESLGLDRDETLQAYDYLSKKHLLEGRSLEGRASLTQYGLDFVEQDLLDLEPFEAAVAPAEEPEPMGIPHTKERRHAFFSIDVVDSTRLNKIHRKRDVDQTINAFRSLIEKETRSRFGEPGPWEGDGGIFLFHGDECQQHSFDAAQMVLQRLQEFNNIEKRIPEPLRVRIAVHTDFFEMPDDPSNLHDQSIDLVTRLRQDEADPNTIVVTSKLYKELNDSTKECLEPLPQPDGPELYCYRLPEEGQ